MAGRRLGIATRTANKHIEHIYRKLGTRDRVSTLNRARTSRRVVADRVRDLEATSSPWQARAA
ncbi:LuxR C-terminal-related transcriptional regulator [Kitasatospora sp. NPDC089509]|uniref:LuxR C-terminal-related transcriptional regulator n=1 Tax=Kitasatospora sp. NPDC089509 TaxID=3364079 RepID=UPI0038098ED9